MTNDFWADRWADLERWGLTPKFSPHGRLCRQPETNEPGWWGVYGFVCPPEVAAALIRDALVRFLLSEGCNIVGIATWHGWKMRAGTSLARPARRMPRSTRRSRRSRRASDGVL